MNSQKIVNWEELQVPLGTNKSIKKPWEIKNIGKNTVTIPGLDWKHANYTCIWWQIPNSILEFNIRILNIRVRQQILDLHWECKIVAKMDQSKLHWPFRGVMD